MPILEGYLTEGLAYLVTGAVFAIPLLWLNIRLAPRLGLIDWPKARGVTEEQIPIVGHSLVLLTLTAIAILMRLHDVSPWFLTTAIVMGIMGHLDDRKPLPSLDKFFFQLVCAATAVYFDPLIHAALTVKFGGWGTFWGIFFLMGLVNAVNFIDGIDGLAGIILFVGAAGYFLLSLKTPLQYPYAGVSFLVMGMMIPFLYTNVVKRRGFMGNVGSYFFAYVLGMMHLSIPVESVDVLPRLALSGLCFLIPIADAATVVFVRVATARSPFHADKGHLHHRLVQTSLNLRYILLIFAMLELSGLTMAFVMNLHPPVRHSWLPAVICLTNVFITAVLIMLVEKASRRRIQSYFERLDASLPVYYLKYRLRRPDGSPPTPRQLQRLEAKVGSEIRITDLCLAEKPDMLFLTLKVLQEPLRGIENRVEALLQSERLEVVGTPEEGEYVRVPRPRSVPLKRVK